MIMFRTLTASLLIGTLVACGGGGAKVTNTTVSEGQQLIDLKKALDLGVISKGEYEAKRRKILRS